MLSTYFAVICERVDYIRALADRFPDTSLADRWGLLCHGGDLSMSMLLAAYSRGIFPWFNPDDPLLWWTPDPRCVILPEEYHMPRRSARALRALPLRITMDRAFSQVLNGCSNREKTWLSQDMKDAYLALHRAGFAHSVEAWLDGELVGGLYGLALGRAFYGESMFHTVSEASRACLAALCALLVLRGVTLLDCQQETAHIMAQGGSLLPRDLFERELESALTFDFDEDDALTREYADMPLEREHAWPFLPWRTRYEHADGLWRPLPEGRRPAPAHRVVVQKG
ncbi:MAG: leucyl/phenylalanyl-tRNA--protein transferase [Desulfovibrionaceae bacterium]|nr:leucyl/phenylalanyl-tRNA--protein transferase [Desulfovibrionaceae bacterium]